MRITTTGRRACIEPAVARRRHKCSSAPAPRCPRVGAPPTAPFRLPSNSCWCSSRTGSRAHWYGDEHGGRVPVTHNTRRVGAYGRAGWLFIGSKSSATACRDSRWRRRGIGRLDDMMSPVACGRVSSRIMICVFLGTDSSCTGFICIVQCSITEAGRGYS